MAAGTRFDRNIETAARYLQGDRPCESERLCWAVLHESPRHPDALHLLALIEQQRGNIAEALRLISEAVAIKEDSPQFHNNLGVIYKAAGRLEDALPAYERAIRLKPDYAEAYYNLGNSLQALGRHSEAVERFRIAVSLKGGYAEAYNNMAVSCIALDRHVEAVECCNHAITSRPDYTEAYNTMASAFQMLGRHCDAIEAYKQALRLQPDYAEVHCNLGMAMLLTGRFEQGWAEYRWRHCTRNVAHPRHYDVPLWDGSRFESKRLLVHYEQGHGDNLQFARYLPMVKERGGMVVFEVRKPLVGLFSGFPGVDELIEASPDSRPQTRVDFCVSLMDLPGIFSTVLQTIPNNVPYIHPDPVKVDYWRGRLQGDVLKVGIVWAGRPTHTNDRNRSCSLSNFAPLAAIDGVRLFSLQTGDAARQLSQLSGQIAIEDISSHLRDFTDTAAVIANLDLLISVDTAVLHLAGAMGRPVWALLPFTPDWRWMLDREDSPWYPTMRLFRQQTPGDWAGVFQRVRGKLQSQTSTARSQVLISGQSRSATM